MSSDLIGAVVRTLVALPLVLGLAYLVLKYGLARRYVTASGSRRMKLVEQLPLGPKTTLSLVELGGSYYLLGHQDSSISLVKELKELPETDQFKIGDIVELKPRTIEEYDVRVKGEKALTRCLTKKVKEKYSLFWKKFAGRVSEVKTMITIKTGSRTRLAEKGEKKVEG